jgi:hypothetical protein
MKKQTSIKQTGLMNIPYSSHDPNLIINFLTGFIYNKRKQHPIVDDAGNKVRAQCITGTIRVMKCFINDAASSIVWQLYEKIFQMGRLYAPVLLHTLSAPVPLPGACGVLCP